MPLTSDEIEALNRLQERLGNARYGSLRACSDGRGLRLLDRYYDGAAELQQLGYAIPPGLEDFTVLVSWPQSYVDALDERLTVDGFRLPGEVEPSNDLWDIWQTNDLDDEAQKAFLDALIFGRSYLAVGVDDDREPLVTVETPLQVAHSTDPRTRRVTEAARFYKGADKQQHATLYLPETTVHVVMSSGAWQVDPDLDRDDHGLGWVPIEPIENRPRTGKHGRSQMLRIMSITDAAARALTAAQVATEVLAVPQRWAAGTAKGDFVDSNGEPLPVWKAYFGAVWATSNPDAKFGQFSAADLRNFTQIVDHYAAQAAGMSGLPLRYFGLNTANPPSADGIRADESRLVRQAERAAASFSAGLERTMRKALAIRGDVEYDDPDLRRMETVWRNPATPTQAQAADAAVKVFGQGISTLRQARRDVGYTEPEIRQMEAEEAERADSDPVVRALLAGGANASTAGGGGAPPVPGPIAATGGGPGAPGVAAPQP